MSITVKDVLDWALPTYPNSSSRGASRHQSSPENQSFAELKVKHLVSADGNFREWKGAMDFRMSTKRYPSNTFASYQIPRPLTSLASEADVQYSFCSNVCFPVVAVLNHLRPDYPLRVNQGSSHAWRSAVAGKPLTCSFDIAIRDKTDTLALVIEMKQHIADDLTAYFDSKAFEDVSRQLRKYVEASGVGVILLGDYRQLISFEIHKTRTFYVRTRLPESRWHLFYILEQLGR